MSKYKTARCVLQREDNYLLAVHSSFWRRSPRRWGFIGGSIEWGEDPQTAVRREVREELDLHLGDLAELGSYRYKRGHHVVYAATTEVEQFDYDEFELLDLKWFSMDEVEELADNRRLHAGYELDAIRKAVQLNL